MGRRLRFLPPDSLVEVTCRTVQGRLLLQPTEHVADLCRGVLARAARLYPVQIHAFVFLGNHYHLLLTAPSSGRLASFMNFLNSNLAREVGRAVRWREKFWGRRYQAILVSNEPAAQVGRLLYVLRHGCKENLVSRPADWPGANAVRSLTTGESVSGAWIDRTALCNARRKSRTCTREAFVAIERFDLAPLPCWRHLSVTQYRACISDLVRAVELETEKYAAATQTVPLGRDRVARQDPHGVPSRPSRRPAPLVHATSRAVRDLFRNAYRAFVAAYRTAARRLRQGRDLARALADFPPGCFPPAVPFVAVASLGSG